MVAQLQFIYSSMNSGKSLHLLVKNFMMKEKGFRTFLMKPEIDDRTQNKISSRLNVSEECYKLKKDGIVFDAIRSLEVKPDIIFVDEAQFLTKDQVWDLSHLVDSEEISVFCYGLKLNWLGEFFEGSHELMKIADILTPIENYCNHEKGALAYFHIKKSGDTNEIQTGYEELYESVSRKAWKNRP